MNNVIDPIEKSWRQLDGLVESLGPNGLTLTGSDGWAVKDHLVHVAAWEQSVIALFESRDRLTAMGVPEQRFGETDAINAAVWSRHRHEPVQESLRYFHDTHEHLMTILNGLTDADLQRPYRHYQPQGESFEGDNRPALDWVAGNTYEHYAEHIDWINQLVRDSSAAR
ncbi:MAG TPA: ClbS/DfsB family four-helix bundle protein [Candidatus Dormibacteraeota bacterium]|nr:ClbS/DfsB family four-helix bundle protein [Candidatus Dormibacteraeota bacterium]